MNLHALQSWMLKHITLLLFTLWKRRSFRQAEIIPSEVNGNYSHTSVFSLNRMQILTKHMHVLDCHSANVDIFLSMLNMVFSIFLQPKYP